MKNNTLILSITGAVIGLGLLTTLILGVYGVSTYNQSVSLKNNYDMKLKANQADFDLMWKTIKQSAEIPEAKKEAFKEIYTSYAQARTSEGQGKVMAWIKESNPNIDLSTYDKLMNIIVGTRQAWTFRQKELVGIAEIYNQKLVTFPSNLFLGMFGFQKIDPKVITSARTEETFRTGQDNEVDLFKK